MDKNDVVWILIGIMLISVISFGSAYFVGTYRAETLRMVLDERDTVNEN